MVKPGANFHQLLARASGPAKKTCGDIQKRYTLINIIGYGPNRIAAMVWGYPTWRVCPSASSTASIRLRPMYNPPLRVKKDGGEGGGPKRRASLSCGKPLAPATISPAIKAGPTLYKGRNLACSRTRARKRSSRTGACVGSMPDFFSFVLFAISRWTSRKTNDS